MSRTITRNSCLSACDVDLSLRRSLNCAGQKEKLTLFAFLCDSDSAVHAFASATRIRNRNQELATPTIKIKKTMEIAMSVARMTEISSSSKKSFDDAVQQGIKRAAETLDGITGAWVADHSVVVKKNKITEYRVRMKVTFILK
jgi:flavin-binding protein dodecin